MPSEIERKYLVTSDAWRAKALDRTLLEQAYFPGAPGLTLRVRTAGAKAWLTIKGTRRGATAPEFEYAIPPAHAREMLRRLPVAGRLKKIRWRVRFRRRIWEVDEFLDEHAGLVLAEIEFQRKGDRPDLPDWVGREVTRDPRYTNYRLACRPGRADGTPAHSLRGPPQRSAR